MNTKLLIALIITSILAGIFFYLYITKGKEIKTITITDFDTVTVYQKAKLTYDKIRWTDSTRYKDTIIRKYVYDTLHMPIYRADTSFTLTGKDSSGNTAEVDIWAHQGFLPIQEVFSSTFGITSLRMALNVPESYYSSTIELALGVKNKFDSKVYFYSGFGYYFYDLRHFQLLGKGLVNYNFNDKLFDGEIAGEMRFKF